LQKYDLEELFADIYLWVKFIQFPGPARVDVLEHNRQACRALMSMYRLLPKKPQDLVAAGCVAVLFFFGVAAESVSAQGTKDESPSVVRPGAPGQPTIALPSNTRPMSPVTSRKDVEFMQGMIMHHGQAVEMTDLIESRSEDMNVRLLGSRIRQSQADEMKFMERWLEVRRETPTMAVTGTRSSHAHGGEVSGDKMLMPGMLSLEQMEALKNAKGVEFDRLFLTGMIQHHEGALIMVKELFDTAGAGQDAEIFNFASDVDSGQRAEIKTMETLLKRIP
jgi:uncharacterized protein (DUF305 family)